MYTLQNAARALGVTESTVKKWIAQDNIEKTVIENDRKRIYIAYADVLALADKHKTHKVNITEQEKNFQKMTGLYSIRDIAKLLDLSQTTVKRRIK